MRFNRYHALSALFWTEAAVVAAGVTHKIYNAVKRKIKA